MLKCSVYTIHHSHEMKALLTPLMGTVPFLIEYLSSTDEEVEIDSQQARKCCDFKRMMLDSVQDGNGIGIPIPIGYDDVQVGGVLSLQRFCNLF